MSLPSITPFLQPPDRATEGSDFGTALAAWVTGNNATITSFNAFMTAVQAQVPAAIGALGLSTASEVTIAGAVTLDASYFGKMHVCIGTTADYPVGLPAAAGNAGKLLGIRISYACTKLVTLDGNASELIDGSAARVMWAGESAILLCDGTGWTKIAGRSLPMVCRMQGPNSQSVVGSTYTNLTLSAAIVDTGSLADTSNNRALIRRPNKYHVSAQLSFQSPPTTVVIGFQLMRDGGHIAYGGGTGLFQGVTPTTDLVVTCSAGAAITMRGYHAHTSNLTTGSDTFLNVIEVISW